MSASSGVEWGWTGRYQKVPANDTGLWSSLSFFSETPSHLPKDGCLGSLSQPRIRETQQPLVTHHPHAARTADASIFFSLSFEAETAQQSLTHVIWKYCDNQEIGLVSRETTVAVSFLLFLKAILIFQALCGKSLLNIPLWECVLILTFIFSLMSGTFFLFLALCLHSAFFLWGFAGESLGQRL